MRQTPRLVIDTDLLVSGIISPEGPPGRLLNLWRHNAFTLVVSPALMSEIGEVLSRQHLRQRFHLSPAQVQDILARLALAAEMVNPAASLPLSSRDPKDNMVLAAAIGGNADYLVTGDQDLLVLAGDASFSTTPKFGMAHASVAMQLQIIAPQRLPDAPAAGTSIAACPFPCPASASPPPAKSEP